MRRFCLNKSLNIRNGVLFSIFLVALSIRALPEFLSGPVPVGFDVLAGYVPAVEALSDFSPMSLFGWVYSPLAVCLLWFVKLLSGVDSWLLMKLAGLFFMVCFQCLFAICFCVD